MPDTEDRPVLRHASTAIFTRSDAELSCGIRGKCYYCHKWENAPYRFSLNRVWIAVHSPFIPSYIINNTRQKFRFRTFESLHVEILYAWAHITVYCSERHLMCQVQSWCCSRVMHSRLYDEGLGLEACIYVYYSLDIDLSLETSDLGLEASGHVLFHVDSFGLGLVLVSFLIFSILIISDIFLGFHNIT